MPGECLSILIEDEKLEVFPEKLKKFQPKGILEKARNLTKGNSRVKGEEIPTTL
jgi:hypothetical protein